MIWADVWPVQQWTAFRRDGDDELSLFRRLSENFRVFGKSYPVVSYLPVSSVCPKLTWHWITLVFPISDVRPFSCFQSYQCLIFSTKYLSDSCRHSSTANVKLQPAYHVLMYTNFQYLHLSHVRLLRVLIWPSTLTRLKTHTFLGNSSQALSPYL
jgi:hypothetical protein